MQEFHESNESYSHTPQESGGCNDSNQSETEQDSQISKPMIEDVIIEKYEFNDGYNEFVENFTSFCEEKYKLVFNEDIFLDEFLFPPRVCLSEYLPVTVVCSKLLHIDLQVPSAVDYCAFASCTGSFNEYFEDPNSFLNREAILRDHVAFVMNSIQGTALYSFTLEDTNTTKKPNGMSEDRLSCWHNTIVAFISRHTQTLKRIQINSPRLKSTQKDNLASLNLSGLSQNTFPVLEELTVGFWYIDADSNADECKLNSKRRIMHQAPDIVDDYWISLMKYQVHGCLKKLSWTSTVECHWNSLFQPILDANHNTLEILYIIDSSQYRKATSAEERKDSSIERICNDISSTVGTRSILSCANFQKLEKLKTLYLKKGNCYLVDLHKLPKTLEELSIDDIFVESREILQLRSLRSLKALRLADNAPNRKTIMTSHSRNYGVTETVLKGLLQCRSLQDLCIWGHYLKFEGQHQAFDFSVITSSINKIYGYLSTLLPIDSQSERQPRNINLASPDPDQAMQSDVELLKNLQSLGYLDNDCFAIYPR